MLFRSVHPIAVRMVYQTAQAVKIPIIGMGGIASAEDAIEMILAGASAVSVGTANFVQPDVTEEIVAGTRDNIERETGGAAWRGRVEILGGAGSFKKKKKNTPPPPPPPHHQYSTLLSRTSHQPFNLSAP